MVVLKQRFKPVTFRVHGEEYEALVKACLNSGVRSISEFARAAALQKALQTENERSGTITGDLSTLSDRLSELDSCLDQARKRIRVILGSSTTSGGI